MRTVSFQASGWIESGISERASVARSVHLAARDLVACCLQVLDLGRIEVDAAGIGESEIAIVADAVPGASVADLRVARSLWAHVMEHGTACGRDLGGLVEGIRSLSLIGRVALLDMAQGAAR